MAFDEAGYRKYAKENNLDLDEVEKEIAYQKQGSDDFKKDDQGFALSSPEWLNKDLGNDWWHIPAAIAVGGLGLKAIQSGMGMLKPEAPVAPPAIEPTFDAGIAPPATPAAPAGPSLDDQIKMERLKQAQLKTAQLEKAAAPTPAGTPVPAADSVAAVAPDLTPRPPAPTLDDLKVRADELKKAVAAQKIADAPPVQAALAKVEATQAAEPAIEGKAGPAVAPKTRAPRRTPEQMAAARAESAGKGPYNWLNSQFGKDEAVTQDFIKKYLGGKAPETMDEAYQVLEKTLGGPKKSDFLKAQKGELTARQMEIGPVKPPENLIKAKAKELTGQKGNISLGQSLNLLGNALGVAGLAQSYKEAKKTGDWSEFGMGAVGQVLGNVAPKAGLAFSLMAPGSLNTGEEEALQDIQYRAKVGSGRGITPPSAYQR